MNASKENCDKAIEELEKIRAHLDGYNTKAIDDNFVLNFLRSCRSKLPSEASYDREKAKKKEK